MAESDAVEDQMNESVLKADHWSPYIALVAAILIYGLGIQFRPGAQFSAIVAAFTAVGVRLFIPYYVSMQVPPEDRVSIGDHPTAGSYHHGAVGLGLIVGWMSSFLAHVWGVASTPALSIGIAGTIIAVLVFRIALPRS